MPKPRRLRSAVLIHLIVHMLAVGSFPVTAPAAGADTIRVDFYCRLAERAKPLDVRYDPAWFGESAATYNHDLAKASLVLANAAYDGESVARILGYMGFGELVGEYAYEWNDWDRVAYTLAYDKANHILAVVLRGTPPLADKDYSEWVSNLFRKTEGFATAAERVLKDEFFAERAKDERVKIWIAGHSRGAAVASIMGARLGADVGARSANDVFVYGFGAPNHTDAPDPAAHKNIHHIVISEDGVVHHPEKHGKYGAVREHSVSHPGVCERFSFMTGQALSPIMSKASVLSAFGADSWAYIASDKGKYAHAPETYMALLLWQPADASVPPSFTFPVPAAHRHEAPHIHHFLQRAGSEAWHHLFDARVCRQ
jgi:hypothetical protein